MLYPADFEPRTLDSVRRWTDDIADCDSAEISIVWKGQAPFVRFAFGHPILNGRPALGVALVAESRKNPLAPGRLVEGDELRRHVRTSVEQYLHANGIEIARKAMMQNAHV
jgi:hypothetical protein